ncbi:MAG: ABC transporter permease [Bacteroidales bacterium]
MQAGIKYTHILRIALESLMINRTRSALTALGIIFGVAAVIAMMAVGNGARKEILDQMKLVGVNNIIIVPLSDDDKQKQNEENSKGKEIKKGFSTGLTLLDAEAIREIIPGVEMVSPEVTYETMGIFEKSSKNLKLSGVTNDFFKTFNLKFEKGSYFPEKAQVEATPVCIIGAEVRSGLFPDRDPIGQFIKCGGVWLKVIGVLAYTPVSEATAGSLGISNYNRHVYAPIQTVLGRFKDRSLITANLLSGGTTFFGGDFVIVNDANPQAESSLNQLDKIVVRMKESSDLKPASEVIKRMLLRRHNQIEDFEVKIPEMLLKQEQRTKDIFNIVLGAIASISLLVGGIGIMNIMLASVLERIREIGVRMAIGARRRDIVLQFLSEATLISLSGGLAGILLGLILSKAIMHFAGILTIISPWSILISFGVSAAVGMIFGYMPARKAAAQDPVTSLRYE